MKGYEKRGLMKSFEKNYRTFAMEKNTKHSLFVSIFNGMGK
jgi:hypothetical protein